MRTGSSKPFPVRMSQAERILCHCCPNMGSLHGIGDIIASDAYEYIAKTTEKMHNAQPSPFFERRYKEHVTYAMRLLVEAAYEDNFPQSMGMFLAPKAAVASAFLLTRFEFYFRIHSRKLQRDGTWKSDRARATAERHLDSKRLRQYKSRVTSVSLAYEICRLRRTPLMSALGRIDRYLYKTAHSIGGNKRIWHLGDRIQWARNRISHAEWADMSGEAVFYGLLTAILFENE